MKNEKKGILKRITALILMLFMVVTAIPNMQAEAEAEATPIALADINGKVEFDKSTIAISNENPTDSVDIIFTLDDTKFTEDINYIYIEFYNGGYTYLSFDSSKACYVGNLSVNNRYETGTYYINKMIIQTNEGDRYTVADILDTSFYLENSVSDQTAPVIKSVTIDKQGEVVESGDVTITVVVEEENELDTTWANIIIKSPLNTDDYSNTYDLVYEGDGVFTCTISTEDLEPCEWYVAYVNVQDVYFNEIIEWCGDSYFYVKRDGVCEEKIYEDVTITLYKSYGQELASITADIPNRATLDDILGDEYIKLPDDETLGKFIGWTDGTGQEVYSLDKEFSFLHKNMFLYAKYEKAIIGAKLFYISEEGKFANVSKKIVYNSDASYKEVLETLELPETSEDYEFTGWKWKGVDENSVVDPSRLGGGQELIEAQYSTYPIKVVLLYLDENGELVISEETKDYKAGTTPQQILDSVSATNVVNGNLGWICNRELNNAIDVMSIPDFDEYEIKATYEDVQIIDYRISYIEQYGEYGISKNESSFIVVDKELAKDADALANYLKEMYEDKFYSELTVKDMTHYYSSRNDGSIDSISVSLNYNEVVMGLRYSGSGDVVYLVVEPGQVIDLSAFSSEGYEEWNCELDGQIYTETYTIPTDIGNRRDIYLRNAGKNVFEEAGEKNAVGLEEEKIEEVKNEIKEAIEKAETSTSDKVAQVVIDMKKEDGNIATVVPKEILEAARNQEVDIVLEMGTYSWTINGNDISASVLKDINLEVILDTKNIPTEEIEAIGKGQKNRQLSLTHDGEFGFEADLTVNVGEDNAGQYGKLYYYNKDGKLEYMNGNKIDENGDISLTFSHASDYVILISENANSEIENTGDGFTSLYMAGLILLGASIVIVAGKRKFLFQYK